MASGSGVAWVGADPCAGLAAIAASRPGGTGAVAVGDVLSLPFRRGAFDGALCVAVVHHLASRARRVRAWAAVGGVLRRGGRALVTVWARETEDPGAAAAAAGNGGDPAMAVASVAVAAEGVAPSAATIAAAAAAVSAAKRGGRGAAARANVAAPADGRSATSPLYVRVDEAAAAAPAAASVPAAAAMVGGRCFGAPDVLVPWHLQRAHAAGEGGGGGEGRKARRRRRAAATRAAAAGGDAGAATGDNGDGRGEGIGGSGGGGDDGRHDGNGRGGGGIAGTAPGTVADTVLLRYYHVYAAGELRAELEAVPGLTVVAVYYDHQNWAAVVERTAMVADG
ncbi:hypothetical protein MMPV_008283 [Pyropia vietnamensis]